MAISLATSISGGKINSCEVRPNKGLIFFAFRGSERTGTDFPVPISPELSATIAWDWLQTTEAKEIPHDGLDRDHQHDGHNTLGWRAYVEDWGHVDGQYGSIVCIKPAYLWHGK